MSEQQYTGTTAVRRRKISGEAVLYVVAFIGIFAFLGTRSFYGSEDRWAEIIREMLLTNDFFHPATNFVVYFDKPVMSYWVVCLAAKILGCFNEWVLRLPSALFGVTAIWATVYTFRRLFDRQTGLLAGWMLLSSFGFLWWARSAEADMANMTMIILAYSWFVHCHDRAGFWHYLLFYLLLFTGALFKGLPAVLVPLAAVVPFVWRHGEIKKHLSIWNILAAIVAASVFFITPLLAEYMPMNEFYVWPDRLSALDLMWRENVVRAFNAFDHNDLPFYVYSYELQRVLLPWSPFFILAVIWGIWQFKKLSYNAQSVLLAIGLIFIMFTASESKRWYYILPIAPFCMGFTALFFSEFFAKLKLKKPTDLLRYITAGVASLALVSVLLFQLCQRIIGFELPLMLKVALPIIGVALLAVLIYDELRHERLAGFLQLPENISTLVVVITAVMLSVFAVIIPASDEFRTFKPFLRHSAKLIKETPPERVLLYSHDKNCLMLYFWDFKQPMRLILQRDPRRDKAFKEGDVEKSYQELMAEIQKLSQTDGKIILVSSEQNMRYLDKYNVPENKIFERYAPTLKEPDAHMEKSGKRKIWIWVLEPENIRKILDEGMIKNEQN